MAREPPSPRHPLSPKTLFQEDRPLANPELGAKQICPNCQAKFYDLSRRPAVCPKCATAFDPEEVVRSRRTRTRAAPEYEAEEAEDQVKTPDADAEDEEEEVDTTPELDEGVEAAVLEPDDDTDDVATPDADIGVGIEEEEDEALEDDADDVPFLEDEDEDDFGDEDLGIEGGDHEDR